jgi:hypothetical protein
MECRGMCMMGVDGMDGMYMYVCVMYRYVYVCVCYVCI